jgi:hypothetical protein
MKKDERTIIRRHYIFAFFFGVLVLGVLFIGPILTHFGVECSVYCFFAGLACICVGMIGMEVSSDSLHL